MGGSSAEKLRLVPPDKESDQDAGGPIVHVGKESDFGVDFYSWPTLSNPLPDSVIDTVKTNRNSLSLVAFRPVPASGKALGGYAYNGKVFKVDDPVLPGVTDPKQQEVLKRFHDVEIQGEGGTSAVMTGDTAKFTWGSGLAHGTALEGWVNNLLKMPAGPACKKALLDHGIALEGKTWKIVDTDSKTVKPGEDAMSFINGKDASGESTKQQILSAFVKVSEDHGPDAAKAQWEYLANQYFPPAVKAGVMDTWSSEAICYVMHCQMWGKFAGWSEFVKTGGDLQKILRLEVDFTAFFDDKGSYREVQPTRAGGVCPSGTMLLNMGHGCMVGVLQSYDGTPHSGDIVFNMSKGQKGPYVLRGVGVMYDPTKKKHDQINEDIANHHAYDMKSLVGYFKSVKKKGYNNLKEMRDWYASPENKPCQKWGLRPLVAMDAVLHAGEGNNSVWILDEAKQAGISENSCKDQFDIVKATVGIT